MASLIKALELKKIIFQVSYLNAEQSEILHKCDSIDQEISDYIKQNYPEQYKEFVKPNETTTESIIEEEDNDSQLKCQNKDIKKLYRKIVELTHPDKAEDQEDHKYMIQTMGNELVQENIQDLETKVEELKQSTAWAWHNCKSPEEKDMLARMILSYKGIDIV